MLNEIKNIWKPEVYHGSKRKGDFFEGWFFKLVDSKRKYTIAVIPGIYKSNDNSKSHAFIQTLDGTTHKSNYFKFGINEFSSANNKFEIKIKNNFFSTNRISLNLSNGAFIKGELAFNNIIQWPKTIFSPGIMGWYSFVPRMECNHGIVSMNHQIIGTLKIDEEEIDFTDGTGYTEKDWGSSFPSAYVWMQSNHFNNKTTTFTASIAKIPWLLSWFRGFIIGLYYNGNLYKFATYTGAKLEKLIVTESEVEFVVRDKNYLLEVTAFRKESGLLHAPYENMMSERVTESLSSEIDLKLVEVETEKVIVEDKGFCAGLDVNGKLEEIVD